jgi:hypothetical protein
MWDVAFQIGDWFGVCRGNRVDRRRRDAGRVGGLFWVFRSRD